MNVNSDHYKKGLAKVRQKEKLLNGDIEEIDWEEPVKILLWDRFKENIENKGRNR